MDLNNIVHEWFEFAKQDLQVAKTLRKFHHPNPIEPICFHCQQSTEKYLKGYIALNGTTPPMTHDLVALGDKCISIDDKFADLYSQFEFLTIYAVAARYPKGLDILESDMNQAIKYAESIEKEVISLAKEKGYAPPSKDPQITI